MSYHKVIYNFMICVIFVELITKNNKTTLSYHFSTLLQYEKRTSVHHQIRYKLFLHENEKILMFENKNHLKLYNYYSNKFKKITYGPREESARIFRLYTAAATRTNDYGTSSV